MNSKLTAREIDILREMAKGFTNAEIGKALFIATPTVKKHVLNISHKIDIHGRTSLVVWAIKHGLVTV